MVNISIEANVSDAVDSLKELKIYVPNIAKKILRYVTNKARTKIRKAYKDSGLKTKTGRLYKSIYSSVKESTGFTGIVSKQAYKFIPQNYGMEIKAKDKYMVFQVDGHYVKVKSIKLQPHNIFEAGVKYVESQEMQNDMDKTFEKEVRKAFK